MRNRYDKGVVGIADREMGQCNWVDRGREYREQIGERSSEDSR